jgi:hypothetical protein
MPVLASASRPVELPGVGFATASWTEADGTIWPLTDPASGWFTVADGVSGLDAAPITLTTDDQPRGGARVRHIQAQPRTITWPLHVFSDSDSHTEFITRWRALAGAFTRTKRLGPGVLEIARPDGTRRRINAYYESGFDGQAKQGAGIVSDSAVLSLFCEDPYWYGPNEVTIRREQDTGRDFLAPFPSVSSSQTLGATTLHNPGTEQAWPSWTITGPASAITATNNTTGEEFTFTPPASHGDLLAGEQVFITTDPPTVRYQDGSNWVGGLDWPGAVLWGLQPGDSDVTFTLSGVSTGSAVELSFHPRFEMA